MPITMPLASFSECILVCVWAVTTAVTMEVRSRSLDKSRPQVVGSARKLTDSAIPPVKSDRPSKEVPYFKASYEP